MGWQVKWAPAAVRDVDARAELIALDSPLHAARWVKRVLKAARGLAKFPERGRKVPEADDLEFELREVVIGEYYRLLYQLDKPVVLVVALVHSHRDMAEFLPRRFPPD